MSLKQIIEGKLKTIKNRMDAEFPDNPFNKKPKCRTNPAKPGNMLAKRKTKKA